MAKVKFTRENIVNATYDLMKQEGMKNISARKIDLNNSLSSLANIAIPIAIFNICLSVYSLFIYLEKFDFAISITSSFKISRFEKCA